MINGPRTAHDPGGQRDARTRIASGGTAIALAAALGLPAGGTTFTAPIQELQANGSCTVLTRDLDLGPLHRDLLGLVIDLGL